MRRQQQHPTQLEIMFIFLLVAVAGAVEIILFVLNQMVIRCGPFCGGLWSEFAIKGFGQ